MNADNLTNLATVKRLVPYEMAQEQRRWALERAIASGHRDRKEIIEAAQTFVDFVNGTNDAEIVRAARELADKVTPDADI